MRSVVTKILAVALMATGISTVHAPVSLAQSFDIYIGRYGREADYRDGNRRYNNDRPRSGCSQRQAIRRAYQYGMRDPAIRSSNRRLIVVDGIGRRGEYTTLQLANRQGCPRVN